MLPPAWGEPVNILLLGYRQAFEAGRNGDIREGVAEPKRERC
jgi:hypothetical protein